MERLSQEQTSKAKVAKQEKPRCGHRLRSEGILRGVIEVLMWKEGKPEMLFGLGFWWCNGSRPPRLIERECTRQVAEIAGSRLPRLAQPAHLFKAAHSRIFSERMRGSNGQLPPLIDSCSSKSNMSL